MPAFNAARGTARPRQRRRRATGVNRAKIRYQPPTARNQRSQIASNRYAISRNTARLQRHLVFTDYQLAENIQISNGNWATQRLLNFSSWTPVMRQDMTIARGSHTFCKRMQSNLRYTLHDADYCFFNVFIITPRKTAVNRDFQNDPPVLNVDYIEAPQSNASLIRLNPAVMKVHYARYVTLTRNALGTASIATETVGDPRSTWRKSQVNINVNTKISIPSVTAQTQNWLQKDFESLPYYNKYQLLVFTYWGGTGIQTPFLSCDTLFTCINTD